MITLPLEGGCQCGALRYQVASAPMMVYNCHCTNCQRIGVGAFSTPAAILESSFAVVRGETRSVEWTADSGAHGVSGGSVGHAAVASRTGSSPRTAS